jgi:SAM-dependent methyltransferase
MNREHLELCSSAEWAERLRTELLPWVFEAVDVPDDLLEIGPGPGAATAVLRERVRRLTAVESDPDLAARLKDRFADDPSVTVQHADATDLPFADGGFDAAASFTMLHHVPSVELQDRLFAEVARVLRPGGVFFGTDSLDGPGFQRLHAGDVCVPVDPLTLDERLRRAGFARVDLAVLSLGVRFVARRPKR